GPDALTKLRLKTPKELMDVSDRDSAVTFDIESVIDGWVLPEEPATVFAQGRQAKVPVIVGSNANEGTTMVEETLHAPPTLTWMRAQHLLPSTPITSSAIPCTSSPGMWLEPGKGRGSTTSIIRQE